MPQVKFVPIVSPLDSQYSSIKQTDNLSGNQILQENAVGISRGKVNSRYVAWKIGPLNQQDGCCEPPDKCVCAFTLKTLSKLHSVIQFIVAVYAVSWFEIKRDDNFHNQQLHIFNSLQRIKEQPTEIQEIAFKNIQHNAGLLPENMLSVCLFCFMAYQPHRLFKTESS